MCSRLCTQCSPHSFIHVYVHSVHRISSFISSVLCTQCSSHWFINVHSVNRISSFRSSYLCTQCSSHCFIHIQLFMYIVFTALVHSCLVIYKFELFLFLYLLVHSYLSSYSCTKCTPHWLIHIQLFIYLINKTYSLVKVFTMNALNNISVSVRCFCCCANRIKKTFLDKTSIT